MAIESSFVFLASRLSHELRTFVAIVNSSLDNLLLEQHSPDNKAYIDRAKEGITRLSKILSNISEATRLEQAHLGLGLYIAKMIALFHHADIKFDNQTDESAVVVTISFKTR